MTTSASVRITILLTVTSCNQFRSPDYSDRLFTSTPFKQYWYAGKAEVNAYTLVQSRYGEDRKGKAVLIFVTEDVSKKKQVKLDHPENPGRKVNVMKMNFTKNFITGIYPYSMMLSVFTPVDRNEYSSTIKVSMSSQEWCGHTYTQLNLRGARFALKSHSYFEAEGDQIFSIKKNFLEDEVWNIIRLDHANLPEGNITIIPGLFFVRLHHSNLEPVQAMAEKSENPVSYRYTLSFPTLQRELSIEYEKEFPHKILNWTETWQERGTTCQARATLDKTLYLDYWNKNKNEFEYLRDSLKLRIHDANF